MKFDVDEVTKLLQIPALVSGTAPGLTHISSECMARLREINDGLRDANTPEYTGVSGQPVANPTPSVPVEAPKSTIAEHEEENHPFGDDDPELPGTTDVRRLP